MNLNWFLFSFKRYLPKIRYVNDFKDAFANMILLTVCGLFVSNTVLLYSVVQIRWIGSYALIILTVMQLLYHCVMGFIFEKQVLLYDLKSILKARILLKNTHFRLKCAEKLFGNFLGICWLHTYKGNTFSWWLMLQILGGSNYFTLGNWILKPLRG